MTPLQIACYKDYANCATLLLHYNADANSSDFEHSSCLHKAAFKGSERCVNILLKNGAKVDSIDREGSTPLLKAIYNNHKRIAVNLIKHMANINHSSLNGTTSLHIAASRGLLECVKILLFYDAEVNIPDEHGRTALAYAIHYRRSGIARLLHAKGGREEASPSHLSWLFASSWFSNLPPNVKDALGVKPSQNKNKMVTQEPNQYCIIV